jgi:enamine deaminase RidA (YjgF/YER057c/UK114 family)
MCQPRNPSKDDKLIHRSNPQPQWSDAVTHNSIAYFVEVPERGDSLETQTRAVLVQAERTLSLCGSDKSRLLMSTIYLKNMRDRAVFNALWEQWLPQGCAPARACVSAELANPDYFLEIAFTAATI